MFVGYARLNTSFVGSLLIKNSSETPTNVDGGTFPMYRVYGPNGLMLNGLGTATVLDAVVPGLYTYSIPATGENGYEVGTQYRVVFTATVNGTLTGQDHAFIVT